jgi:inner membrane protein
MTEANPTPIAAPAIGAFNTLVDRPWFKAGLIALAAIMLLVPLALIGEVTGERDQRRAEAVEGIHRGWAGTQTIAAPVLLVPALQAGASSLDDRVWIAVPASDGELAIDLAAEPRARGIFSTVVYRAQIAGSLRFDDLAESVARVAPGRILWDEALLVAPVSDLRGARLDASMTLGDRRFPLLARDRIEIPGMGTVRAFIARVGDALAEPEARTAPVFTADYALRGSVEFRLAPVARELKVKLASNWPHPSFGAGVLADSRAIRADGFTAQWNLAAAELPRAFAGGDAAASFATELPLLGVSLADPVPAHRLVERAQKYDVLLIAFTFLVFFLFETLWGARLHIVHYAVVGLALCLFYLLLLSFAELIGFVPAYALAAALVVVQASLYGWSLLRSRLKATVFALVLAAAYAYFFVLLMLESHALVAGALALFLGLSVAMYATRRIDWVAAAPVDGKVMPPHAAQT